MSRQAIVHCIICGEKVEGNTAGYVLADAIFKSNREVRPGRYYTTQRVPLKEDKILFNMSPARKFVIHRKCLNRLVWNIEHPDIILDDVIYRELILSTKGEKRVWKIAGGIVPKNPTRKDIDLLLAKAAINLLKDK